MDKCRMTSRDLVQDNIEAIGALFPNCIKEAPDNPPAFDKDGKLIVHHLIDFDVLKQELSRSVIEGRPERYEFNWPGKRAAALLANMPIEATLRPCREESVNFDTTENLYIEGDNLDVLKLLCDNYRGKIKMIYIDPPYNTGNDFVYEDDFAQTGEEYKSISGDYDDQGNRLVKHTTASGRFHTSWLNMMYPRLKIAQRLLTDDGVIFISIDDNEVTNLRRMCDEIFGEVNFVAQCVWQKIHSTKNDAHYLSENHEYILMYARTKKSLSIGLLPRTEEMNNRYSNPDNDPRGPWQSGDLVASGERSTGHYVITSPVTGKSFDVPQGKHWVYSEENLKELVSSGQIYFGVDGNAFPRKKRYLSEVQDGRKPNTLWLCEEVGHNQSAAREVKALFDDNKYFDFPKPVALLSQMLRLGANNTDSLILDFFSGSATTAHAVMQLNAEDGGHRNFIMVQVDEKSAENSEAAKAGFKNICEIGKERIRRAGKKIATENATTAPNLDIGFRVLKLDFSNMEDVYYRPEDLQQNMLGLQMDNVKIGRTSEDLLFQVMLEKDIPLSSKIEKETVSDKTIFNVADGYLLACLDVGVTDEVVTAIAKKHPVHAVFRDKGMATDSTAINFEQIFSTYSPDTKRSIL
ncbi:MAG: site-specific DNA-methyltransferase [Victivallales bacterium]|nr:site-specific DNA-methyltransferase [Victivallales bacterium]